MSLIKSFTFFLTCLMGVIYYYTHQSNEELYHYCYLFAYGRDQPIYTIFTYGFIHKDLDHIIANMSFFLLYGGILENNVKTEKYVSLLLYTLILSVGIGLLLTVEDARIIGFSGVTYGIMGAFLTHKFNYKLGATIAITLLKVIVLIMVILECINSSGLEFSFLCHIIGFIVGLFFSHFFKKIVASREKIA